MLKARGPQKKQLFLTPTQLQTVMTKEEIVSQYPSLCYTCKNARRIPATALEQKGVVGCCMFAVIECEDASFINDAEELFSGWVDLRSAPFGKSSGMTTNLQLMTVSVKQCNQYNP